MIDVCTVIQGQYWASRTCSVFQRRIWWREGACTDAHHLPGKVVGIRAQLSLKGDALCPRAFEYVMLCLSSLIHSSETKVTIWFCKVPSCIWNLGLLTFAMWLKSVSKAASRPFWDVFQNWCQLAHFHLQNIRGGRVKLSGIVAPEMEYQNAEKGDALYAMELALSLEVRTCIA